MMKIYGTEIDHIYVYKYLEVKTAKMAEMCHVMHDVDRDSWLLT